MAPKTSAFFTLILVAGLAGCLGYLLGQRHPRATSTSPLTSPPASTTAEPSTTHATSASLRANELEKRLTTLLHLTPEQQEQVRPSLSQAQTQMQQLARQTMSQLIQVRETFFDAVKPRLTTEQAQKLEHLKQQQNFMLESFLPGSDPRPIPPWPRRRFRQQQNLGK